MGKRWRKFDLMIIEKRYKSFGICPRCGIEVASLDSYSGALKDDSGEENSPIPLYLFRGQYTCKRCMNRIVREENSLRKTRNTNRELKYLEEIGFQKEV